MNWKKAHRGKLPTCEVLAIGYQNEILVGRLYNDDDGEVTCDGGDVELSKVVAYIPAKDIVKSFLETTPND